MALSRFSTLPAQPKAIDAIAIDIDIDSCCCPTVQPQQQLKPKLMLMLERNPLKLSFTHAARRLLDTSTGDIHWQLMQQLAPRGVESLSCSLCPYSCPHACPSYACPWPCPAASLSLYLLPGPESMAQFWLAAVEAAAAAVKRGKERRRER